MKENRTNTNAFETFRRSLIPAVFTASFLLTPFTCFAAEFSGTLDGVTISDVLGTNSPPTASFTYTIDGDTVTFDASGSSDSDGSIGDYKWNFDNDVMVNGLTATYSPTDKTNFKTTLTVVDNNNGVAISQQTVNISTDDIVDDFSEDNSANYTVIAGGVKIYNGAAHGQKWFITSAFYNKDLGSSNYSVHANVYYSGGNGGAGLIIRGNLVNQTGYCLILESGRPVLKSYNAGKETWLKTGVGAYPEGIYKFHATNEETTIKFYINDSLVLEKSDLSYPSGNFIGFRIRTEGDEDVVTLDDFTGSVQ